MANSTQRTLLAIRLKTLRKEQNLTQLELSRTLGFSRGLIGNYEIGSRNPDYETLICIANFFHVSTDYLLGVTDYRGRVLSERMQSLSDVLQDIEFLSNPSISDLRAYLYMLKLRDGEGAVKK